MTIAMMMATVTDGHHHMAPLIGGFMFYSLTMLGTDGHHMTMATPDDEYDGHHHIMTTTPAQ